MWDFDPDEWVFFLAALPIAFALFARLCAQAASVTPLPGSRYARLPLLLIPPACLALVLYPVLQTCADPQVRGHPDYVTLFLAGGAAWIGLAVACLPLLGISVRDDAIERRNGAATLAAGGMMIGVTLAYAGSNVGSGPTIWTTIAPAAVAAISLFLLAYVLVAVTGTADAITVDRDDATGVRLAAFLVACGGILGRAMAGDFASWPATWRDFLHFGWPAAALVAVAAVVHAIVKPTPRRPRPSVLVAGIVPAAMYLLLAAAVLGAYGKPHTSDGGAPVARHATPAHVERNGGDE